MPIDSSLFRPQGQEIDVFGSINRGLQIADTIDARRKKRAEEEKTTKIKEAYKAGIIQNPDGSFGFDKSRGLAEIAKYDPEEAMNLDSQLRQQEREQRKAQIDQSIQAADLIGRIAPTMVDQQSYEAGLKNLSSMGVDVSKEPPQFNPSYVKQRALQALSVKDQLAQQNNERDYNLKKEEIGLKRVENAIKKEELNLKNKDFERLPEEDRDVVKTLATTNGKIKAIANNIKSSLESWDGLKDTDKVAKGRLLLKVLNSPLGADAIGSEEAKRLGGKLEFAMSNISNSNPTQFGRDLEGFRNDSLELAKSLERSIKENENVIKDKYSKVGVSKDIGSSNSQEETKQINGATYVKTQGGWKLSKVVKK